MTLHLPNLTPSEILAATPVPVNSSLFEAAPGTVRIEKMAKPIARGGYWEVTYNFTVLPPMIKRGLESLAFAAANR